MFCSGGGVFEKEKEERAKGKRRERKEKRERERKRGGCYRIEPTHKPTECHQHRCSVHFIEEKTWKKRQERERKREREKGYWREKYREGSYLINLINPQSDTNTGVLCIL